MYSVKRPINTLLGALCFLTLIPTTSLCFKAETTHVGQGQPDSYTRPISTNDEEQIRQVVLDSQFFEMLKIYVSPADFDRKFLAKYWVPESKGGKAITKVLTSVQRLLDKKWHYDKESANELFEIRGIKIFSPGDIAEVETRERWYVPTVDESGRLVIERDSVFEFPVRYRLLRMEGKWFIQSSSGPYRER